MSEDQSRKMRTWPCTVCGSAYPGDGEGCGHCRGAAKPFKMPERLPAAEIEHSRALRLKIALRVAIASVVFLVMIVLAFTTGGTCSGVLSLLTFIACVAIFVHHRGYFRRMSDEYQRDPHEMHTGGSAEPPWRAYPREGRFSRFWEFGSGQQYLYWWHNWYLKLPIEEQRKYRRENPPPLLWLDIYGKHGA